MKKSQATYAELLDAIVEHGSITTAARSIGVSPASAFSWMQQSAKGEPGFDVEWMNETVPLHAAVKQASRQVGFDILEGFRKRMRDGVTTVAQYQGKTVYRRDPACDRYSDSELIELGIDRYLRDGAGNFIPETVWTPPPVQGVLALLAAEFPRLYGNKNTVEISQKTSGVVRHQVSYSLSKPSAPMAVVEVLPPSPAIAPPEEIIGSADDDDLSDILGEMGDTAAERPSESQPAPVRAEPPATPPEPELQAAGLTPLQRDLMARLKAGPGGARTAPVQPTGSPAKDQPDDVPLAPPAGAMKVL
ncbi:LysR family transcriptional regulator [Bradyrhizobium japonicum]|uniref:LysR family transcriptional regulator n=1 Tax=Bradyrhizobium japonicum TaxID=375 RepID=UPI001BA7CD73|nr:LysR family transcriptional regulator [Bradyrhizobium japonicum]MBR0989122.1 LysR family transcriptional regulator [Bradyrhizobium japonicum]